MSSEVDYPAPTGLAARARVSLVDAARADDLLTFRVLVDWRPGHLARPWRQLFDASADMAGGLVELWTVPITEDEERQDRLHDVPAQLIAPFVREEIVRAKLVTALNEGKA